MCTSAGASIPPLRPWCIFPPCFRKIFGLSEIFLQFYLFPKNFLTFIRQNFWLFFSHRPQISNFPPIFAVSVHFPPVSWKLFFPPYFYKFPPVLGKFTCLFTYFTCISPPNLTMMHLCITQCTYWTPLHLWSPLEGGQNELWYCTPALYTYFSVMTGLTGAIVN